MKRHAPWREAAFTILVAGRPVHSWMLTGITPAQATAGAGNVASMVASRYIDSSSSLWISYTPARRQVKPRAVGKNGQLHMQVWSNPQAVQEYQDLLEGKAPDEKDDGPSVIVGAGRLGTALAAMGMGEDLLLGRGDAIPVTLPASSGKGAGGKDLKEFPIYVCVPEGEVAGVIDKCPPEKRDDLVFVQGGCMEPLLKSRGLCRPEMTQATLYFGIDKVGDAPKEYLTDLGLDGRGEKKFAAETAVCGKWRGALAQRLERSTFGLSCTKVFYLDWRRIMFEKLIFECAVNAVGALHKFQSVEFIVRYHSEELVDMLFELKNTLRGTLAVTLLNGYPERLLAYGEASGDRPTRMDKELFQWYNKLFWDISELGRKKSFGDPCPMHTEYLEYGLEKGMFEF